MLILIDISFFNILFYIMLYSSIGHAIPDLDLDLALDPENIVLEAEAIPVVRTMEVLARGKITADNCYYSKYK